VPDCPTPQVAHEAPARPDTSSAVPR
jgi:hypothetical protein